MQKTKTCPYCQSLNHVVFMDCNPVERQCFHCGRTFKAYPLVRDGFEISTDLSEDEILSRAISHYGEPAQVLKCIEELAELGVELITSLSGDAHYFRIDAVELTRCLNHVIDLCRYDLPSDTSGITIRKLGETDIRDIASELADVSITTTQMLKIFNCSEEVEKIKQEKLSRLEARMKFQSDLAGLVNGGDSQ